MARKSAGKGEKVRQELTGAGSNARGQATPVWSKAKQERAMAHRI
jgi:hypothetical protein